MYTHPGQNYSFPVNSSYQYGTANFQPNVSSFEIWFKADNIASPNTNIIMGVYPYKLRKKPGLPRL